VNVGNYWIRLIVKKNNITLTVQSAGSDRFRLGVSAKDSRNIFKRRRVRVVIKFHDKNEIVCSTACGPADKNGKWTKINPKTKKPFRKKGYDLNKVELSKHLSKVVGQIKTRSKKIDFRITKKSDGYLLTFLRYTDFPEIKTSP